MPRLVNLRNTSNGKGGQALKFKLVGNWAETIRTINGLGPKVKTASIKAQMKLGEEVAQKVKGHLRDQDLGWIPLSRNTQKRKNKAGMDERTLIGMGTYYHNIKAWQVGNQHLVLIGVRRGVYTTDYSGKKSKIDVATIAAIHEFSSGRRVPRRPLWNPTITEMGGLPGFKKIYLSSLKAHLRRAGVPFKDLNLPS